MSSPSSAAAFAAVVTFMGLLRSILSDVGDGALGKSFCIIEKAELEMP